MHLRSPALIAIRAFSTTLPHSIQPKTNVEYLLPPGLDLSSIPPYPHSPAQWYKQSNHGLYGGLRIRFGNNVSPKTKIKTRRSWKPNVQKHALWSVALNHRLRLKVTARVLKTIDKVGGLDNYVLGGSERRIKDLGAEGWKIRWAVLMSPAGRRRVSEERRRKGLPVEEWEAMIGMQVDERVDTPEMRNRFNEKRLALGLAPIEGAVAGMVERDVRAATAKEVGDEEGLAREEEEAEEIDEDAEDAEAATLQAEEEALREEAEALGIRREEMDLPDSKIAASRPTDEGFMQPRSFGDRMLRALRLRK